MNNLNRHMRSDAVKWVIVGIVLIAIIATIVLGCFSSWFTNWDVETWFGGEKTEQTDPEENNKLIVTQEESVGINLLMSPAISNAERTTNSVTVSITNVVMGLRYVWSLSATDMNEDYASSCVNLSVTEGTSTTVSLIDIFDHAITLSCVAYSDADTDSSETLASAFCRIDCLRRFAGLKISGKAITDNTSVNIRTYTNCETFEDALDNFTVSLSPDVSIGTVGDNFTVDSFELLDSSENLKYTCSGNSLSFLHFAGYLYLGNGAPSSAFTAFRQNSGMIYNGVLVKNSYSVRVNMSRTYNGETETLTKSFNVYFPTSWASSGYSLNLSETGIVL